MFALFGQSYPQKDFDRYFDGFVAASRRNPDYKVERDSDRNIVADDTWRKTYWKTSDKALFCAKTSSSEIQDVVSYKTAVLNKARVAPRRLGRRDYF